MNSGFDATLDLLDEQTQFMSSPGEMEEVSAFSRVLMYLDRSPELIGELFRRLREKPSIPVMLILMRYLNINPVPAESSGKVDEMVEAWLRWGRDNGYQ